MSAILAIPQGIYGFLNAKAIQSQANTTTWLILGALAYQGLSALLTPRIAMLAVFTAFFATAVPTLLISTGRTPNVELRQVEKGKTTALFPGKNGEKGKPSGRGIALLIIGIRISHPLGIFAPGAKQTGDYFMGLVKTLENDRANLGYLGGTYIQAADYNSLSLIAYFDSMEKLHEFAHANQHREAWNWWNRNVKNMPHLGVYHEAYDVPANHWEAVYLQTPRMLLGATEAVGEDGKLHSVIEDARKGVWRTSEGRMGRNEKTERVSETDPYVNE